MNAVQSSSGQSEDSTGESGLGYLLYKEETLKYLDLIKFFQRGEESPYSYNKQILLCGRHVSAEKIKHFVRTAFLDHHKNLYFVLDSHLLTSQNFNLLMTEIQRYYSKWQLKKDKIPDPEEQDCIEINYNLNLCFLVRENSYQKQMLVDTEKFKEVLASNILGDQDAQPKSIPVPENVRITTSKMSLLGKTTMIQERAMQANSKILTLNISGDLDPANLEQRFLKL